MRKRERDGREQDTITVKIIDGRTKDRGNRKREEQ